MVPRGVCGPGARESDLELAKLALARGNWKNCARSRGRICLYAVRDRVLETTQCEIADSTQEAAGSDWCYRLLKSSP